MCYKWNTAYCLYFWVSFFTNFLKKRLLQSLSPFFNVLHHFFFKKIKYWFIDAFMCWSLVPQCYLLYCYQRACCILIIPILSLCEILLLPALHVVSLLFLQMYFDTAISQPKNQCFHNITGTIILHTFFLMQLLKYYWCLYLRVIISMHTFSEMMYEVQLALHEKISSV